MTPVWLVLHMLVHYSHGRKLYTLELRSNVALGVDKKRPWLKGKNICIVSPGIEPGYIVFPSHKKQCIYLVRCTAICMEHEKISSSALGLA